MTSGPSKLFDEHCDAYTAFANEVLNALPKRGWRKISQIKVKGRGFSILDVLDDLEAVGEVTVDRSVVNCTRCKLGGEALKPTKYKYGNRPSIRRKK